MTEASTDSDTQIPVSVSIKRTNLQVAATSLLEHLSEPLGDKQRRVDESVDAVAQARLGGVVQLGTRLADALLPADLVELVYLRVDLCLLFLNQEELLQLLVIAGKVLKIGHRVIFSEQSTN